MPGHKSACVLFHAANRGGAEKAIDYLVGLVGWLYSFLKGIDDGKRIDGIRNHGCDCGRSQLLLD